MKRNAFGSSTIVGLIGAAALFGGCIQISGEVEELSKTVRDDALVFDSDSTPAGERVEDIRSFELDLNNDLLRYVVFAGVKRVTFVPREGVAGFDFIGSVSARLLGSDGLPDVTLAEYVRDPAAEAQGKLVMQINPDVDLSQYLRRGATCRVDLEYAVQPHRWSVDMLLTLRLDLGASF